MNKYLYLQADANDGDYVTSLTQISDKELELIKPVIDAIKNFTPYSVRLNGVNYTHDHNYPVGECIREDLGEQSFYELYGYLDGFEEFDKLIPYAEYGIHTIDQILIVNILEKLL